MKFGTFALTEADAMQKKEQLRAIKNLSSSDYVNLFLANSWQGLQFNLTEVQAYDYNQVCERMKVPTTIFRPNYNYALLLEDGNITMQMGTETKRVYAPAAFFISAGQIISVQAVSENIAGTLVVLENESLNRIFSEMELLKILQIPPMIPLSQVDNDIVNGIARMILREYNSPKYELQVLIALVQALLYKLVKHSGINDLRTKNHLIAIQFKELVYKNFASKKNISFYTSTLEVSENYLNRCTQQIFGKSAKRFVLEVAILQSQLLLQDLHKSVTEVAYELNFEDASYFSRLFRKITGLTPSAYKHQIFPDQETDDG
ncbi:MAG: AraC family transcriptional regulator [Mucilaginibacter sp.]|uniref:helix-turn-helix domain-containing protein n=1 Tax=Mucilaginibacter sp. TaxID=1882438 RepID=UPI0031B03181